MKRILVGITLALTLMACEKDEIPIEPFDRGGLNLGSVDLGQGYVNQIYFSLEQNASVGMHQIGDWDIALKNGADSRMIVLNDARFMLAWKSGHIDLAQAEDTSGYGIGKKTEVIATAYSDPAMGDLEGIFLIDLGFNEFGLSQGMFWIEVPEVTETGYTIRYKKMSEELITERVISKTQGTGFNLYSLLTGNLMKEPPSDTWEFRFTKFTYQFINPPIAYLVTGLVLNPENTWASEYSVKPYDQITTSDTSMVEWSSQPDIIGYDWKTYSFDSGTFMVDSDRSWLIRNAQQFYYKIRFTGFYDENGNAGVPTFEYQLL